MTVILDGTAMHDRQAAHSHLAQRLALPDYYGRNLDALYDLLTQIGTDTELVLRDSDALVKTLGRYGKALMDTLADAAKENPHLKLTVQ